MNYKSVYIQIPLFKHKCVISDYYLVSIPECVFNKLDISKLEKYNNSVVIPMSYYIELLRDRKKLFTKQQLGDNIVLIERT